jgi:hypothetical protein
VVDANSTHVLDSRSCRVARVGGSGLGTTMVRAVASLYAPCPEEGGGVHAAVTNWWVRWAAMAGQRGMGACETMRLGVKRCTW